MKDKIKDLISANGSIKLDQIYQFMADKSKPSVRGTINLMVKKGELKRVSKGVYTL